MTAHGCAGQRPQLEGQRVKQQPGHRARGHRGQAQRPAKREAKQIAQPGLESWAKFRLLIGILSQDAAAEPCNLGQPCEESPPRAGWRAVGCEVQPAARALRARLRAGGRRRLLERTAPPYIADVTRPRHRRRRRPANRVLQRGCIARPSSSRLLNAVAHGAAARPRSLAATNRWWPTLTTPTMSASSCSWAGPRYHFAPPLIHCIPE